MRVALRGFKKIDDFYKTLVRKIEIVFVVDLDAKKWGDSIGKVPIISPMRAYEEYKKGSFEKIIINPYLGVAKILDISNEMKNFGLPLDMLRVLHIADLEKGQLFTEEDLKSEKYHIDNFKTLQYLEYHIADKCNLNCASCSHFSPLVRDEFYPDVMQVEKDLRRLNKIFNNIEWIRVLGGEPFLNKDWRKYLKITRQVWGSSKISIVTNGLLLRKLTDEDYDFIKENNIWIDISLYQPLWNKIDTIINKIKTKKVNYEVNGTPIFNFTSVFNLESTDDFITKRKRCNVPCTNLYKGKITPCPIMMYTSFFNEYFDIKLPKGYTVDIYEDGLDYEKFMNAINKPMPICKFCDMSQLKSWKQIKQNDCKLEDWVVMRG